MVPRPSILVLLWLNLAVAVSSAAQPQTTQVLVLKSYERHPFTVFSSIFRTELSKTSAPINFLEVSIRPDPFGPLLQDEPVVSFIASTLGARRVDLVVSIGAPAALFAKKYHARLFPTTPLLQMAVDWRFIQNQDFAANETAVGAAQDVSRLIDNILLLLPETKNAYAIIGDSELERLWRRELSRELAHFKDRLGLVWLSDLSLAEILTRSSQLPPNSVILYVSMALDGKGVVQSEELGLTQLHEVANAPIFGPYDIQLGHGIVGGPLTPIVDMALTSAGVARSILDGESPGNILIEPQKSSRPTYDARELQRWGIREARLPAGSVVLFRQPSVWDQYGVYIVGMALLLGLQSAMIAALVIQRSRRRRTELALRESERRARETADRNRDLAGRLITAQDAERTRIARDLHDDLSQQLAGLGIMLSSLKRRIRNGGQDAEIDRTVMALQDRTAAVVESVRNISHELHPGVLEHSGLVATLRRHCADFEQHHHVTVTFIAEHDPDALSPDVALCLFRVAQEALTNTLRHARARTIRVELIATNEGVELDVIDDGIGFEAVGRSGSGLGLRSMNERVQLAGGTLSVESRPGQGTKVLVRISKPEATARKVVHEA